MPTYAHVASFDPEVRRTILSCREVSSLMFAAVVGCTLHMNILINQGRPLLVTLTLSPINWFIGVPLAFFGARISGISGIFGALLGSYAVGHIILAYFVYSSDWHALSKRAASNS